MDVNNSFLDIWLGMYESIEKTEMLWDTKYQGRDDENWRTGNPQSRGKIIQFFFTLLVKLTRIAEVGRLLGYPL